MATIPPYPFYVGDRDECYVVEDALSDPDSMWIVRPQLFFHCSVRPLGAPTDAYGRCPDDIPLYLVFFSSFEDLGLHLTGTMESNGVRKLYGPSHVPTLYVRRVQDLLGRYLSFRAF